MMQTGVQPEGTGRDGSGIRGVVRIKDFLVLSFIRAIVLMIGMVAVPGIASADWGTVGSAGISAGTAGYASLAITSDGTPYVAYADGSNGNKATVMNFNGASWATVGSAGFSAGTAAYVSFAIASDGTPYVAYRDSGNGNKATVMKFDGTSWTTVGSAGFSAGTAPYTSLAIASDGTPYVAYQDGSNGNKATVKRYDGTSWVAVGSADFSAEMAFYTSLVIASDGTPYVAYQDGGNGNKATVMKFDGTSWTTVGSAGFSAGTTPYTSLAIASDGTPYVAYQDGSNGSKATVMKYNGTSWTTVGSAGFSVGGVIYLTSAIASDGTPYVAYQDGGIGNKASVMKFDGTSWTTVGSAGFSAGTAAYVSFAIASDGTPCVAYRDNGNGNKATVMKLNDIPTVTTTAASSVAAASATAGGNVTAGNGASVTARGVCRGPSANPAVGDAGVACTTDGTGAGSFTTSLTSLTGGTTYHIRAYATNSNGTGYGSDLTFSTPFSVTATAGTGGTISPSGTASVSSGNSQSYAITASPGYRILDVKADGVSAGALAGYTFPGVTANHTIDATFQKTWSLTAGAGTGGSISNAGSSIVDDGSSAAYAVTPNAGYAVSSVTVNGVSQGAVTNLNLTITADTTVSATFAAVQDPGTPNPGSSSVTANTTTTQAGVGVTLTPTAVSGASAYLWDFGNGQTMAAATANPVSYDYDTAGAYTVAFKALDGFGGVTATATTAITVNFGTVQVAPSQSPSQGAVTKAAETLSTITASQLQISYGVTDTTMRPLSQASTFTATAAQPLQTAIFRISMYDMPVAVDKLRLIKLKGDGTSREYAYGSSASYDQDGSWWITDAQGYDIPITSTLAASTPYWANFVIQDNGPFDADPVPRQITDPVTIALSDVAATGGGEGGGCVYQPFGAVGPELAVLLSGGAGLAALRRKRK